MGQDKVCWSWSLPCSLSLTTLTFILPYHRNLLKLA